MEGSTAVRVSQSVRAQTGGVLLAAPALFGSAAGERVSAGVEEAPSDRTARRRVVVGVLFVVLGMSICGAMVPHSDVDLYHRYASAMAHGPLSRGLPREYPALAGALFFGVAVIPVPYLAAFEICMALGLIGLVSFGLRLLKNPAWAWRMLVYLVLGTGAVMFTRYDLLPAGCVFVAVICARRGMYGRAWLAVAAGTALKFFPALLLPGFAIYERRRTGRWPWRRVATTALGFGVLLAMQSSLAPGSAARPIRYEMLRGFEFSSVPGTLTLLLNPLHLHWAFGFGAWQVVGPAHSAIAAALSVAEVLLLGAVWWAVAQGRLGIEAASLAVISVAVLTDRALAPQYLIWLAPLWALWPARLSWLASSALTSLIYPTSFTVASLFGLSLMLPTSLAVMRNATLILGTVLWVRSELRATCDQSSLPAWKAEM